MGAGDVGLLQESTREGGTAAAGHCQAGRVGWRAESWLQASTHKSPTHTHLLLQTIPKISIFPYRSVATDMEGLPDTFSALLSRIPSRSTTWIVTSRVPAIMTPEILRQRLVVSCAGMYSCRSMRKCARRGRGAGRRWTLRGAR